MALKVTELEGIIDHVFPKAKTPSGRECCMSNVTRESVPADALLMTYRGGPHPERWGRYADCFSVSVERAVTLPEFVFAFYTSRIFKAERLVLKALLGASSTDAQALALATGSENSFAVWRVGDRTATQLLMCDQYQRTRSWFRVVPLDNDSTRLQFGSAVAERSGRQGSSREMGFAFGLLLGFHVVYSKALLWAASVSVTKNSHPH